MWSISKLKEEARKSLKQFGYWVPLLVTFVAGLLTGGSSGGSASAGSSYNSTVNAQSYGGYYGGANPNTFFHSFEEYMNTVGERVEDFFSNPFTFSLITISVIFVVLFALAISLGWSAFISGPVYVGKSRYFMEHRAFETKFERLFWSFRKGRYMNIVKIMFVKDIKVFLWSLLFIIPGIIKSYEYYMIPYILSENPQISMDKAFELSRRMTDGEKWHIFCLNLSFIGWYLLGLLCCCVGTIFVVPYQEATSAELYQVMREKAHGLGFSDFSELPGFFPQQP